MGEAAKLWARHVTVTNGTERAVLMWMSEVESHNQVNQSMSAIARSINLSVQSVQRAGANLESHGLISRLFRGAYLMSVVRVASETSDLTRQASITETSDLTRQASDQDVLTRADLNKNENNNSGEGQVTMFGAPEWEDYFNEVPWAKRLMSLQQRVNIETNFGDLDVHAQIVMWHDWHDSRKGKPKSPYTSLYNWLRKAKETADGTGTRGGSGSSSELAQINRSGRAGGYADPDRYS